MVFKYLLQIALLIFPLLFSGLIFILILKSKWLDFLKFPLDFRLKINQKRVFGKNKTFLGLVSMLTLTSIIGILIYPLFNIYLDTQINSTTEAALYFGILGLAYTLGELPNSFLKRQLNIAPGHANKYFRFLDLCDSLIVCGLVYVYIFNIDTTLSILAVSSGIGVHYLTDILMKKLKVKN